MEDELAKLRKKLSDQQTSPSEVSATATINNHPATSKNASQLEDHLESHEIVGALMDMKSGSETRSRKLEDAFLSGDQIQELFDLYEYTEYAALTLLTSEIDSSNATDLTSP